MQKFCLTLALTLGICTSAMAAPTPDVSSNVDVKVNGKEVDVKLGDDFDMHLLFHVGYANLNMDNLNTALTDAEYANFSPHTLALGGSLQMIFNNFLTELEGNGFLNQPILSNDYLVNMSNGNFVFNVGYTLKPHRNFAIYPYVGLGAGFTELQFNQRNLILTFEEFLKNPGRQSRLTNAMFLVNAGLGIQHTFRGDNELGVTVGIRGGYLWTPFASNWWQVEDTLNNNSDDDSPRQNIAQVSNGPAIAMNGPYIKAMIGF